MCTNTFLLGEDIVLERCQKPSCCHSKVHCPFCDVQHFKPSLPARVRDHLNKSHFQHAVYLQGLMIVKCFKKCSHTAGHYHCPLCAAELLKRVAFTRHLTSHAKKLGYSKDAVLAPNHKQPDKILCGGQSLSVCKLSCPPWKDKHYHCPHCACQTFGDLSTLISHVWRCRGPKEKELPVLSRESDVELLKQKGDDHQEETGGDLMLTNLGGQTTQPSERIVQCGKTDPGKDVTALELKGVKSVEKASTQSGHACDTFERSQFGSDPVGGSEGFVGHDAERSTSGVNVTASSLSVLEHAKRHHKVEGAEGSSGDKKKKKLCSGNKVTQTYATRGIKTKFAAVQSGKLQPAHKKKGRERKICNGSNFIDQSNIHQSFLMDSTKNPEDKLMDRRKNCQTFCSQQKSPSSKKSKGFKRSVSSSSSIKPTVLRADSNRAEKTQVSKQVQKSVPNGGMRKQIRREQAQKSPKQLFEHARNDGSIGDRAVSFFPKVVTFDKSLRPGKRSKALLENQNIFREVEGQDSMPLREANCGTEDRVSSDMACSLEISSGQLENSCLPSTRKYEMPSSNLSSESKESQNKAFCLLPQPPTVTLADKEIHDTRKKAFWTPPQRLKDSYTEKQTCEEDQCLTKTLHTNPGENLILSSSSESNLMCKFCQQVFLVQAQLDYHITAHHVTSTQKSPMACALCDYVAQSHFELVAHRAGHKPEDIVCRICLKQFRSESYLRIHMAAIHTNSRAYVCPHCGKLFRHQRYLRSHMKRHGSHKPHVCGECGWQFYESHALLRHAETHKKKDQRRYKFVCDKCHTGYNNRTNFMDHLNKHTGKKPYSCPQCEKCFAYRSMLSRHKVYRHSNLRPFSCEFCAKSFRFNSKLLEHMILHTGMSRHTCGNCQKPLASRSSLRQHQRKCRMRELWVSSNEITGQPDLITSTVVSSTTGNSGDLPPNVCDEAASLKDCTPLPQSDFVFNSAVKENSFTPQGGEDFIYTICHNAAESGKVVLPLQLQPFNASQTAEEVSSSFQTYAVNSLTANTVPSQISCTNRLSLDLVNAHTVKSSLSDIPPDIPHDITAGIHPPNLTNAVPNTNVIPPESCVAVLDITAGIHAPNLTNAVPNTNVIPQYSPDQLSGTAEPSPCLSNTEAAASTCSLPNISSEFLTSLSANVVIGNSSHQQDYRIGSKARPINSTSKALPSDKSMPLLTDNSDNANIDFFICSGCEAIFSSVDIAQTHLLSGKCLTQDIPVTEVCQEFSCPVEEGPAASLLPLQDSHVEVASSEVSNTLRADHVEVASCEFSNTLRAHQVVNIQSQHLEPHSETEMDNKNPVKNQTEIRATLQPQDGRRSLAKFSQQHHQETLMMASQNSKSNKLETPPTANGAEFMVNDIDVLCSTAQPTSSISGQVFTVTSGQGEPMQEVHVLPGRTQDGLMALVQRFAQQDGVGTMQIVIQDSFDVQ